MDNKEYGGICINLPPVLNIDVNNRMTQIKELFFMGHALLDQYTRRFYYRSLLIGRDQLPVWKKIAKYHNTLLTDIKQNISYHWEYGSVLPHNQNSKEEHKKMGLWDMKDNSKAKVFYTAPVYRVQLIDNLEDASFTLNISTYGEKIDSWTTVRDEDGAIISRYPTYSAEAIIERSLANDGKSYIKDLNNIYVLKPPFAVCLQNSNGLASNNFFFNTNILDFDIKDTCSITFYNCDVSYDSQMFYRGDKGYVGDLKNVILDLNKNTRETPPLPNLEKKQGILTLMSAGTTSKNFTTYKGVLDQNIPYTKICIKGRNKKPIGTDTTAQVRIDLSKFDYRSELKTNNELPNSLEDIKIFLNSISNWYNRAQVVVDINPKTGAKTMRKIESMYKIPQVK